MSDTTTQAGELRRGWAIILAMFLCAGVTGMTILTQTAGVFIGEFASEFGWSRGLISAGFMALTIGNALSVFGLGFLVDRIGVKLVLPFSLVVTILGLLGLSIMPGNYGLFVGLLIAIGLLGTGTGPVVITRILAQSFDRARGTALGLGLVGGGLFAMFAPGLLGALIVEHDWRAGYLALAGLALVCAPLILAPVLFQDRMAPAPARETRTKRDSFRSILFSPVYLRILLGFVMWQLAIMGCMVHFIPMVQDRGLDLVTAGIAAGAVGACVIVFRVTAGIVIDRVSVRLVTIVFSIVGAILLAIFATGTIWSIPFGILVIGLMLGAEFDLIAYFISRLFQPSSFGRASGVGGLCMAVSAALSMLFYGLIVDWAGSYMIALVIGAALAALSSLVFYGLPPLAPGHVTRTED